MVKIYLGVFLLSRILLAEYSFQCESTLNSRVKVKTFFTSSKPELTEIETTLDEKGEVLSEKKTVYLSAGEACGEPVGFKETCDTNVMKEGSDFNYSYRCEPVYGDVVFLKARGEAYFRCEGENVPVLFKNHTFRGCK